MKAYVKPDVYYENFALAESIATSCAGGYIVKGLSDLDNCYAITDTDDPVWKGIQIYAESTRGCDITDVELVCGTLAVTGDGAENGFGIFGSN